MLSDSYAEIPVHVGTFSAKFKFDRIISNNFVEFYENFYQITPCIYLVYLFIRSHVLHNMLKRRSVSVDKIYPQFRIVQLLHVGAER